MQTVKHFRWEDQNEDKVGKRQHYHDNSDKIMLELKTIKNWGGYFAMSLS